MRMLPRWATVDDMGTTQLSKTYKIARFDIDESTPTVTCILLRAWMLWRFQQHGFGDRDRFKRKWWAAEADALKLDIGRLGIGARSTGSAEADAFIKELIPAVLND